MSGGVGSCGLRVGLGLQGVEEIGGALRVRGGGEDGALVGFEDAELVVDIAGVVVAKFGGELHVGAEKRRSEFGDQFFAGVAFVAPFLAFEAAVRALAMQKKGASAGRALLLLLR
jgi:hypothetical protein